MNASGRTYPLLHEIQKDSDGIHCSIHGGNCGRVSEVFCTPMRKQNRIMELRLLQYERVGNETRYRVDSHHAIACFSDRAYPDYVRALYRLSEGGRAWCLYYFI
jgi:hypothetical protein